jgi:MFS family permease
MARRVASVKAVAAGQSSQPLSPDARTLRINFILHVANGALFALADAMTSTTLILTAFLSQLTTSNVLVSLLSPMREAGWFLPQLFLAPWVERAPRKISTYRAGTTFRMVAWVVLVICVFTIEDRNLLLVAFFACIAAFSILAGFAGLPFMIITAKIIPAHRRGLVFGLRQFIGGALGIAGGGIVAVILNGTLGLTFPRNYALVFALAAIGYTLSYTTFGFVKEEPDEVPGHPTPVLVNLRRAWAIARIDGQYRHFMLMRIALLFGTACVPFLTVYAKRSLGVSDGFIASLVSVTLASSLLSNLVWARISDRHSNRLVMILTSSMGLLFCALAALETGTAFSGGLAQILLMTLFALSGAMLAGMNLAAMPLMIEVAAPEQQYLYFGLSNTILGVVLLLTSLIGLIVDRFGYSALFVFSASAFVLALERLARLRDPRKASQNVERRT